MNEKEVHLIENMVSFQGEGPSMGRSMLLLRFKKCNLNCKWCDTKLRMRISMESHSKLSDIQKILDKKHLGLLLTGGEPTFSTNFQETIDLLNNLNYSIANVETNGYYLLDLIKEIDKTKNIKYIYSPKIFSETDFKIEVERSKKLFDIHNVYFKIVISPDDKLYRNFLRFISSNKIYDRVYLMPEGTTDQQLIENSKIVFDLCEEFNFNFSSRMHIIYKFI